MSVWYNVITLVGLVIVASSILLLVTFALFSLTTPSHNPYVDVIGFLVLPGVLTAGLIICPLGMLVKAWRVRRRYQAERLTLRLPKLDLNDQRLRRFGLAFTFVTLFLILPLLGLSGYHGYHYTESTSFCGQVCHVVMEPQYTAHQHSPHARVTCAECHIGAGAGWFVKSKLSGTRQVFKVLNDTFPRPVPPAITELRPARETCEECHWPAKFFGQQLKTIVHYAPDERTTRREIRVLLKTGGGDDTVGRVEGIHAHMALAGRVEYIATDEELQNVPWVRYVLDSGEEFIYRSDGLAADDPAPRGTRRTVDCMDCHNRAAHLMMPPYSAIDAFLEAGHIDRTLPFIKREALAALAKPYPTLEAAMEGIERSLRRFYADRPESAAQAERIQQAIETVRAIYRRSFFPAMNVDWRTYPNNIGHLYSPGCLRCHDGHHVNQHGTPISSDCEVCHTFFNELNEPQLAVREGQFVHSMDLSQHTNLRCDQCHTGGPLPLCADCHRSGAWLNERGREGFRPTTP
ncbi:MAG: cytochrome C [Phycisphaerales bacterium]|nr:MAG: cytochrome C [Phycisphaerales bacterium]